VGIYGLLLEGYNPGALVPGVVGAIAVLLALYAFQVLPVNYAGLGLIVLGVILMSAEFFVPSFGVLGLGGIVAFVVGSIILIDSDVPGFGISPWLVGGVATVAALGVFGIIYMADTMRRKRPVSGAEQMLGATAEALEDFDQKGTVFVHGERWNAITSHPINKGQRVRISALDGLTLQVEPITEN
ncbi:MAG: NfeD family protein, partial [Pseudomonadota bacterium]